MSHFNPDSQSLQHPRYIFTAKVDGIGVGSTGKEIDDALKKMEGAAGAALAVNAIRRHRNETQKGSTHQQQDPSTSADPKHVMPAMYGNVLAANNVEKARQVEKS